MSRVLVVGNILKDVYLNLDARTEKFETDARGVRWLDLAFDASKHCFFRRNSSFGGATISLEVLTKMGVETKIMGTNMYFKDGGLVYEEEARDHRYILVFDEDICYFTASQREQTKFFPPKDKVEIIYIDRSANLNESEVNAIKTYLKTRPNIKLVIHLRKTYWQKPLQGLLTQASLVFTENFNFDLDEHKTVLISEKELKWGKEQECVLARRINLTTHLSTYLIAGATILGGKLLGRTKKECLKLAKVNIENSTLNATLSLKELEEIMAN